jgi:hypothetical protein
MRLPAVGSPLRLPAVSLSACIQLLREMLRPTFFFSFFSFLQVFLSWLELSL